MNKYNIYLHNDKENLVIRSAELNDIQILNKWWNDGKVMAHAGFPNGLNEPLEETQRQVEAYQDKLSQLCIIEYNDIRIGEMSYHILNNLAEIGIKICEFDHQNHGLGTTLLNMLIEHLFTSKTINSLVYIDKIILDTNLTNERAQHVYEKIGFDKVAVKINSWKDQLGNPQSSVHYELTKEKYKKLS